VIVADEPTPAYELVGQAGVQIEPEKARACFTPRVEADGSTERHDVFVAGCVRSAIAPFARVDLADPLASDSAVADGVRVAASVIAALREPVREARHEVHS